VCGSVLQCAAVRCSVLQCVAVCYIVLQCTTMCYSVLQYVTVCRSMLQCVAVFDIYRVGVIRRGPWFLHHHFEIVCSFLGLENEPKCRIHSQKSVRGSFHITHQTVFETKLNIAQNEPLLNIAQNRTLLHIAQSETRHGELCERTHELIFGEWAIAKHCPKWDFATHCSKWD